MRPPKFKPTLCFVGLGRASLEMYVVRSSEHSGENPYHSYRRLVDTMPWTFLKRLKPGLKPVGHEGCSQGLAAVVPRSSNSAFGCPGQSPGS